MGKTTIPPLGFFLWMGVWGLGGFTCIYSARAGNGLCSVIAFQVASLAICISAAKGIEPIFTNFQPPSNSQTCPSSESLPIKPAAAEIISSEDSK